MKKIISSFVFLSIFIITPIKSDVLIDVRTIDEYSSGHIENSLNIEWESIEIIEKSISKDEKIYLYCRSGNRSGKAKNILIDLGYQDVINLGGIDTAAKTLGLNIVKKNK
tara:strand:- start:2245 stop:2574 length:330 start_codon:yes stop_codon:yes gene_type:complete